MAVDDILIRACVLFELKHAIYGCTGILKSALETSHYSSSGVGKGGSELCQNNLPDPPKGSFIFP